MKNPPDEQVPALYHRRIGDILVTAVSDGYLDAPYEVFNNAGQAEVDAALGHSFGRAPPRISVNCFLIRHGGRVALVDTGSAATMGPTLGRLPETMAAAGATMDDVDTVLLSHMHPDHSNGLTSPAGERRFRNAEIVVSETDLNHWRDDGAMARATERQRTRYFESARFQIAPYQDRLKGARGEVFPGVTAMAAPGHTPGHTAYLVSSGDESLLIWGDVCHVPEVQLRRPEVTMVFDSDPQQAVATRRRILDMTAVDRQLVAGMHLHFPGFARVRVAGDGFEAIPESWAFIM
ncbi:MAG: MBL fold metallo-hydrolase [Paracoccaceae bacterium]